VIEGDGIRIRRATRDDILFVLDVVTDGDVQPFLGGGGAFDAESIEAELAQQDREPDAFGRFVIEVQEDGQWQRAGTMGFERVNKRSRIAHLERLAVHPTFRGRRLADDAARLFQRHLIFDLGYHRIQLEIYGFNERAQRHAERSGFVREGVRRKAYWRHDEWTDGVIYGLVAEDLDG
jgi:RimJ/RimL family protein N-acetyltransferase